MSVDSGYFPFQGEPERERFLDFVFSFNLMKNSDSLLHTGLEDLNPFYSAYQIVIDLASQLIRDAQTRGQGCC